MPYNVSLKARYNVKGSADIMFEKFPEYIMICSFKGNGYIICMINSDNAWLYYSSKFCNQPEFLHMYELHSLQNRDLISRNVTYVSLFLIKKWYGYMYGIVPEY